MTKEIQLANGKGTALIDDEDFEMISKYSWRLCDRGYAVAWVDRKQIRMHRLILGLQKGDGKQVDHINRNKLDNRRHNLRLCTQRQNLGNQRKRHGTSKYKGVCWSEKRQRWCAQIRGHDRQLNLGHFVNEEDAAHAYDKAARKHFGEFARVNFPQPQENSAIS